MTFLLAKRRSTLTAAMAVLLTVTITSFVNAVPFAGLNTTGLALPGWQNSELVQGVAFGSTGFEVTVEYAVFGPGDFGTFLPGADPSGGTDYVYAFQARLDGDTLGVGLESLLAGFDLGAPVNLIGSEAGTGDKATSAEFFNATSAEWDWKPSALALNEVSDVLFYTSPFGPKPDGVTVKAGFFADAGQSSVDGFASPVPEPTSLLLVGTAGMLLVLRRRRF